MSRRSRKQKLNQKQMDELEDQEEQSLRARMDAAEEERQKRNREREARKKGRRQRVEKMIYQDRPVPLTEKEKFDLHTKKIFEELEKRERMLEEKMKRMASQLTTHSEEQNKQLEDKLVNNFIKKLELDAYTKWDSKLNNQISSLNNKIEEISKTKPENSDTSKIKTLFTSMQNRLKTIEEEREREKVAKLEEDSSDDEQYDVLQKQINDISLLLAKQDKKNVELNITDLEKKIGVIVNENVDHIYTELDKKIDSKIHQDKRVNEVLTRIAKLENIKVEIPEKKPEGITDDLLHSVIDQLKHNNDKKMEKMYTELRKRINKIEEIEGNENENVNVKESMLKDMEKRINEIEVYKKKLDLQEKRKRKRKEKDERKKKRKSFTQKKNRILKKHNLNTEDVSSDESEEIEIKKDYLVKIKDEELLKELDPYIELLNKVRSRLPSRLLSVANEKEIDNIKREMAKKYERNRSGAMKQMLIKKNLLNNKYSAKKAYGVNRGTIILDDKEYEKVTIYKKYNCEVKERFLKKCHIFMKYMHNFNYTFLNKETKDRLVIYYDQGNKPNMIIIEYKTKHDTQIRKVLKKFKIGENFDMTIESYEDIKGEHLILNFFNKRIELNKLFRIMSIESNCFFEIYVDEFDDEILFDI